MDKELGKLIERHEVEDLVTKLFILTDSLDWKRMLDEILGKEVYFDMRSLTGEEPRELTAKEITDAWEKGLRPMKAVHHQMGNLTVTVSGERAMATCYATATHFLPTKGAESTRTFAGSYEIGVAKTLRGWRIDSFRYLSRFVLGNLNLGRGQS